MRYRMIRSGNDTIRVDSDAMLHLSTRQTLSAAFIEQTDWMLAARRTSLLIHISAISEDRDSIADARGIALDIDPTKPDTARMLAASSTRILMTSRLASISERLDIVVDILQAALATADNDDLASIRLSRSLDTQADAERDDWDDMAHDISRETVEDAVNDALLTISIAKCMKLLADPERLLDAFMAL